MSVLLRGGKPGVRLNCEALEDRRRNRRRGEQSFWAFGVGFRGGVFIS